MPDSETPRGCPADTPPPRTTPGAEKVVLFGTGDMAATICMHLRHDSAHEVVAFTVDRAYLDRDEFFGLPVVPYEEVTRRYPPDRFRMMVAISFSKANRLRAECVRRAKEQGYALLTYISSRSMAWPGAVVGENCRIGSFSVLQPFARLGDNVFVGDGVVVGHHSSIGDHCFLASGCTVAGEVTIGPYSFLGTGCTVRNKVSIAPETVIGAGAVILQDTIAKGVYLAANAEALPITSDRLPLR